MRVARVFVRLRFVFLADDFVAKKIVLDVLVLIFRASFMFNSLYRKTLSGFSFVWLPRILMFKKKKIKRKEEKWIDSYAVVVLLQLVNVVIVCL